MLPYYLYYEVERELFLGVFYVKKNKDNYQHEHTRKWSNQIKDGDGFIFITPEYNHGYSPALKNALDFLFNEWKGKTVGLIGCSGSGAVSSIKQLRSVLGFMKMKPLEYQVGVNKIWEAFDQSGKAKSENINGDLQTLFKKLEAVLYL